MLKHIKSLVKVIEWLVFISLALILVVVFSPVLPITNVPKSFIVVSGSMEPVIKTGSVVFTRPTDPKLIKVSDIIAFTSPSNPKDTILHRVSSIKSDNPLTFSTKGDNNNSADNWDVMGVGIKGVYVGAVPYLGNAAAFIKKPLGFILIIVIPALLFIVSQILNIKNAIKDEIKKGITKESKSPDLKIISFLLFFLSLLTVTASTKVIKAIYSSSVAVAGISIVIKDFVPPPVPELISPPDNAISDDVNQIMTWTDALDYGNINNPVYYLYQRSSDASFNQIIFTSEKLIESHFSESLTANSLFWWRVKACDAIDNCSNWSSPWKLTLNAAQRPTSEITNTDNTFHQKNFEINYITSENSNSIRLCYAHNLGKFSCSSPHPVSGHFNFDSPQGDGVYELFTIAYNGNAVEDKNGNGVNDDLEINDLVEFSYRLQVDTQPPTSGLDFSLLNKPPYHGQNLIKNGDFSAGSINWVGQGTGNHHVTSTGFNQNGDSFKSPDSTDMFELGFRDGPLDETSTDSIYQVVSIPKNLSTDLNFRFRIISQDTVDYDRFRVEVQNKNGISLENILTSGSDEKGGSLWIEDAGWRSFQRSLAGYTGKTIRLWFGVINGGNNPSLRTWAYLDDINLTTLDTRTGDTNAPQIETHDTGSGISSVPTPTLTIGENVLNTGISDIASNLEATKSASIIVSPITINQVGSSFIELFNNSSGPIDVSRWLLESEFQRYLIISSDNTPGGTTVIEPNSALRFYRHDSDYFPLNDDGNVIYLKDLSSRTVDSTKFPKNNPPGSIWQRTPVGLGTWNLFVPDSQPKTLGFNLVSRKDVHKITFTIFNIPAGFGKNPTDRLSYEIIYTSNGRPQGIAGDIGFNTVVDSKTDRDFYLGTCSTGGTCTADTGIGSTITATINGNIGGTDINPPLIKSFSYQ